MKKGGEQPFFVVRPVAGRVGVTCLLLGGKETSTRQSRGKVGENNSRVITRVGARKRKKKGSGEGIFSTAKGGRSEGRGAGRALSWSVHGSWEGRAAT